VNNIFKLCPREEKRCYKENWSKQEIS